MAERGRTDRAAWEGEMFRLLAENVLDYALFIVDPDRHVLSWSKGAERLLGFTEAEIVGRRCDVFFTPEDVRAGVPQRELDEALATGRGDDDRWHVRKDGSRFWSSGMVTPLQDAGGSLRGFAKIMRDRTDLKKSQDALAEARAYAEAIVATVREPLVVLDVDLRVTTANRSFYLTFGVRPEDTEGRLLYDLGNGQWDIPTLRRLLGDVLPRDSAFTDFEVAHEFPGIGRKVMLLNARKLRREGNGTELILLAIEDVTAAREAERARRDAEARFTEMVKNVRDHSIFLTDPAGVITSWNVAAERIIGYAEAEAVGRPFSLIFTPEDVAAGVPDEELRQAREHGRAEDERWHVRKDGTRFWALGIVTPLRDPDGRLAGFSKVLRDMTAWKRADEALRASEARFGRFMHHLPGLAWAKDAAGRYMYANEAAARAFGRPPADLYGKTDDELFPPETAAQFRANDREALAAGTGVRRVETLEQPDGVVHYSLVNKFAVPGPDGAPALVGGMAVDVTDEMRARAVVEESEERFRATFDQAAVGIAHVDPAGRWLRVNRKLCEILGYAPDELLGLTFQAVTHPDDLAADLGQAGRLLAGEIPTYELEKRYVRKDGSTIWANLTVSLVRTPAGGPKYFISVVEDVGGRKRAEAALRESEDRLRTLSDNLPHGAVYQVLADRAGGRRFLYVSAGVERLLGVPAAEVTADAAALYGLVHEADRPRVAAAEEAALQSLAPFDCEFRSRTRAGGLVWVHARSAPRPLPTGEVVWEGLLLDVTARKDTEAELARLAAESDRRRRLYEAALSNTPDLVYVFDLDHRFIYANEGLLRMWGRTWDEAIGKTCLELGYEPWHAAMHDREIEQVVATKRPIRGEVPFTGTFGRRVYDYIFVPVLGGNGEVEAVAGTTRDVTDRRAAEDRYRTVLESITDAFFALGRDWRFTYVNRQAERVLGREPGDLIGKDIWDEYPGLLGSEFERAYRRAMADRETASLTDYYPDHDRWYEVHVYPAEDGISVYFRDVSDRERAEAELARLHAESDRMRRLYETALSNSPDYTFVFDPHGRFTYANEALLALWGRSRAEALGRTPLDLGYPPDLADRLARQVRQAADTRQAVRDETPFASRFGPRAYEYSLVPVVGAGGAVEAVVGSAHDITDRKALEGRLRDQAEQLREADRRKDDFLATLAHELRNPLAPIRNGLQVMRLAAGDARAVEQARAMMERQMAVLVRLIDDLLDVSRITRGKLDLRRERVDLAGVVRAAVETARPVVEAGGHRLTIDLPPAPVTVDADPLRLAQVFSNLLTNAAKYTDRGGRITLGVERDGGTVAVRVRDTGIGIAPEHLAGLFQMFSQVDSALERSQGGLGIGLALVKGLVEMHGGTVGAASDGPGRGSEFVVRLPAAGAAPAPASEAPAGGGAGAARRRVLVADDNRDAAETLALVLRLKGHEVHAVHDGPAAVEAGGWFRPDLVLLDIGMPGLNGYEACRRIRREPWGRAAVIVALTGWGQEEDRRRSEAAGFDHHRVKPIDPAALDELLARAGPGSADRAADG